MSVEAAVRAELEALGEDRLRIFDVHSHTGADVDGTIRTAAEQVEALAAIGGRSAIFPLCVSGGYEPENRRVVAECEQHAGTLVPFARLDPRTSGAALRRANFRKEAREPLREALELAHRCGARPLEERARTELAATGARPRKAVFTGVESLTPSELRVARMAAEGMTNREIAQALTVTAKTVETHLRHVYQKLGVAGRGELGSRMAAEG